MAEEMFERDPEAARRTVSEARAATTAAIADLRSVVRGIHPPVLADRGLEGAIRALALDMAVPVEVVGELPGRPPAPIESAVYFAVAECLANSAKHAGHHAGLGRAAATHGSLLRVVVGDDGRGGADVDAGHRHAGGDAPAGGVRRHDVGVQPRRGAHDRHPGGAVRPDAARLVLAEDNALLRAGLTQLLEGSGFVVARAVDNAPDLDVALTRPRRRRRRPRRPDAADVHRRGAARRHRGADRSGPASRCWCCRSTSSSSTHASCSPAARARSATCSRTGSPTCGSSSTAYAGCSRAAPCSTPRWSPR